MNSMKKILVAYTTNAGTTAQASPGGSIDAAFIREWAGLFGE
jgi:hypothetical protein